MMFENDSDIDVAINDIVYRPVVKNIAKHFGLKADVTMNTERLKGKIISKKYTV